MDTNKIIALIPDMAAFVTVVETGSFTKAAEKLGVTPSGISRQISRLENALAVVLLERSTRKQSTTVAGKEVFDFCQAILENAREVVNISDNNSKVASGHLRIAVPKAFGKQVLEPLLIPFMDAYPNIKLKVKVTDHLVDPIHDDVDIIFRLTDSPQENLVSKKLGDTRLMLCASPNYLEQRGTPQHPNDLVSHDCLFLGEAINDNIWEFSCGGQSFKIPVEGRYVVNHTEMRLNGVKQGLGIGIFPDFAIKDALKDGSVIRVLNDWHINGSYQGQISMQFAQTRHMPIRIRAFIDYISEHLPGVL